MLCLLYHEVEKNRITEELLLCMQHEEDAQEKIEAYNNVQKKAFVDWVNSTKTMGHRTKRFFQWSGKMSKRF